MRTAAASGAPRRPWPRRLGTYRRGHLGGSGPDLPVVRGRGGQHRRLLRQLRAAPPDREEPHGARPRRGRRGDRHGATTSTRTPSRSGCATAPSWASSATACRPGATGLARGRRRGDHHDARRTGRRRPGGRHRGRRPVGAGRRLPSAARCPTNASTFVCAGDGRPGHHRLGRRQPGLLAARRHEEPRTHRRRFETSPRPASPSTPSRRTRTPGPSCACLGTDGYGHRAARQHHPPGRARPGPGEQRRAVPLPAGRHRPGRLGARRGRPSPPRRAS